MIGIRTVADRDQARLGIGQEQAGMCGHGVGVGWVGGELLSIGILVRQLNTIPAEGSQELIPPRWRGGSDIDL